MYQPYFDKFIGMTPYLEIGADEWKSIKEQFSEEDIRESLATILMNHYDLPYATISKQDALDDLRKLKSTFWSELFVEGDWKTRYVYDSQSLQYRGKSYYIRQYVPGNKASNYFQQKNRWSVDSAGFLGPKNLWKRYKSVYSICGALFTLKYDEVNANSIRQCIALRSYICSQFRPSAAKTLYEMFNAKVVLDFSAGWGDRLAGFFASHCTETYIGIDPKTDNHPIYQRQADFYREFASPFENEKETFLYESPAEDWDNSQWIGKVDLVFTSPPYFNVEKYSEEDTQSCNRYTNIELWNTQFLQKSLDNVWATLRDGGHMIVNIADVMDRESGEKLASHKICEPMIAYMTSKYSNCQYEGVIGMQMSKRPNNHGINHIEESTVFAEPMWVFRKTGA